MLHLSVPTTGAWAIVAPWTVFYMAAFWAHTTCQLHQLLEPSRVWKHLLGWIIEEIVNGAWVLLPKGNEWFGMGIPMFRCLL